MTDQTVTHHSVGRRALTSLSRHGVRGTLERVHRWGIAPLVRRVYQREEHIWVLIDVDDPPPLPDGYTLRRGGEEDLDALAAIGGIAPATARSYLEGGARLYVVTCGDELAFATWIHVDRVPLATAPGGWLHLPPELVSFEDSIAAPAHRRGGIGPLRKVRVEPLPGGERIAELLASQVGRR